MDNVLYLSMACKKSYGELRDVIPSFEDPKRELTNSAFLSMEYGCAATFDCKKLKLWDDPQDLIGYLMDDKVAVIVGYGIHGFEFPILLHELEPAKCVNNVWEFSPLFKDAFKQLRSKSIDLLLEIEKSIGFRIKLNDILSGMFEISRDSKKEFWSAFNSTGISNRVTATNLLLDDVICLHKIHGVALELGQLAYRDSLGNRVKFDIRVPTVNDLKHRGQKNPF